MVPRSFNHRLGCHDCDAAIIQRPIDAVDDPLPVDVVHRQHRPPVVGCATVSILSSSSAGGKGGPTSFWGWGGGASQLGVDERVINTLWNMHTKKRGEGRGKTSHHFTNFPVAGWKSYKWSVENVHAFGGIWKFYDLDIPFLFQLIPFIQNQNTPPLDLGHFVLKSIWPVTNGIMKFICRMSGWWTEQIMLKMDSAWKHAEIEMIPKWLNDEKQQTEQSQISRFFCQVQIPLETMKGVHWAAVAACSAPAATNPQKSRT